MYLEKSNQHDCTYMRLAQCGAHPAGGTCPVSMTVSMDTLPKVWSYLMPQALGAWGGMSSCEETWVPATTETNCLPAKLGPLAPRRVSPAP